MLSSRIMSSVIMLVLVMVVVVASASPNPTAQARAYDDQSGGGRVSTQASKRLMKELKDFYNSDSYSKGVFTVELIDDDIYEWHVKLFINDPDNPLYSDLQKLKKNGGEDHILLHVRYNSNYPFEPPFVRVVYPYLLDVGPEGALCMELLTKIGWNSSYTIEPLILSIAVLKINHTRIMVDQRGLSKEATYEEAKRGFDLFEEMHIKDGKWTE